MAINLEAAGLTIPDTTVEWSPKDPILYALALGCGTQDLQYTTECALEFPQQVLPTFAVTVYDVAKQMLPALGKFDEAAMVHGEQSMTFHRPLKPEGKALIRGGIAKNIWDKGSGALVGIWTRAFDLDDGEPLFDLMMNIFLMGEGGWGGEPQPRPNFSSTLDRAPDEVVTHQTDKNQALIYRLTGDRNPLHCDPAFAIRGGFDEPILHGLCTLGIAGRHLLKVIGGDDPAKMQHIEARFAAPVKPGEILTISIWRMPDGLARFEIYVGERNVISRGLCRFSD